jgi:lipoate-protein ligase A
MRPQRPALVLGSTQPDTAVDAAAVAAAGVEPARRRSGGGAVLVDPADTLWVDVIVPRGDRLWDDDVGRSFLWLGSAWRDALDAVGVAGEVHAAGLVRSGFSGLVCFAGVGSGEVLADGRKVVGLSQRRTRDAARFQSVAYTAGADVGRVAALLTGAAGARAWLDGHAAAVPVGGDELLAALLAALPTAV